MIENSENRALRFVPFSSFVSSSFWFKFTDVKLEDDKLEEITRHIWGYYSNCEKTGAVLIDCTSLNRNYDVCSFRCYCHGYHINKNTIEGFKNCDKNELVKNYGKLIIQNIQNRSAVEDPTLLITFVLLTFCNLKNYTFTYWFAFPALLQPAVHLVNNPTKLDATITPKQVSQLHQLHRDLPENQKGFFGFRLQSDNISIFTLKEYINDPELANSTDEIYFAFLDPSLIENVPGWPLRNFLSLLKNYCKEGIIESNLRIVSLRGGYSEWINSSFVFSIRILGDEDIGGSEEFVGWQKNDEGKLHPKKINLSDDMDPIKLSSCAVTLNLKLVKWRLQPDLDLTIMKNTSCLLLGAGTLGCSVARALLAWGVEKITFVDSGIISYSNPARQSLYTFEDAVKGLSKAKAAAKALKSVHPGMNVTGEVLRIPIPGNESFNMDHVRKLTELIENHDAIFLLTDSRESRWLPTLLSSFHEKIAITIALGYDSYLVVRHGVSARNDSRKLGCYFCNDVVAPGNSSLDRTLDQQCTVTRPGLSGIASSFGVELFVSLLQHVDRGSAPGNSVSCLGKIPHSIRGFIADYEHMYPFSPSFDQCVACSSVVLQEYGREKDVFLQKVFKNRKYLEEVTSLSLYQLIDDQFDFPIMNDEEDV